MLPPVDQMSAMISGSLSVAREGPFVTVDSGRPTEVNAMPIAISVPAEVRFGEHIVTFEDVDASQITRISTLLLDPKVFGATTLVRGVDEGDRIDIDAGIEDCQNRALRARNPRPQPLHLAGGGRGWQNRCHCRYSRRTVDAADDKTSGRYPMEAGIAVKIGRTLVSAEEIDAKLAEMGAAITHDYEGKNLLMVAILKGAFVVMADLARHVALPVEFDFMAVSSYGASTKSSGVVRILKDLDEEIEGRHVLIVEDIIDTGLTLQYLIKNLEVQESGVAEAGGAAHQGRYRAPAARGGLRGIPHRPRVRDRLRPRLRRQVPEPAARGRRGRGVGRGSDHREVAGSK